MASRSSLQDGGPTSLCEIAGLGERPPQRVSQARPTIVIARKVGRLANRILLFSHFVAASVEHGFVVWNPAFFTYASNFPATAGDALPRFPPNPHPVPPLPGAPRLLYAVAKSVADLLYNVQQCGGDVGLIRLRRDQSLDLNDRSFVQLLGRQRFVFVQDWFFRNRENCERHRDVIVDFFTPWASTLSRARAIVEPARGAGDLVVGVHIRLGDYATFKGGRFYYSTEQYRTLMAKTEAAFPGREVVFLVCSDAPVDRRVLDGFQFALGTGHPVEDLYAFARCDLLIGPPSTYTTWASFYGEVPLCRIYEAKQQIVPDSFVVRRGL